MAPIPAQPPPESVRLLRRSREVQLQLGDPRRVQGAVDLAGTIGEGDRLSYRLVGLRRWADTQVDEVNDDTTVLAPSLTWRLTDATTLTFLAHYIRNDAKSLQFLPSQGTLTDNPNGTIPRNTFLGNTDWDDFDFDQYGIGYAFEHRFGNGTTFRQNLRQSVVDYDLQVVRGMGFPTGEFRNVTTLPVHIQDYVRAFSVDNQIEHTLQTGPVTHTLLAGLDFQEQKSDYSFGRGTSRLIDIYNPVNTPIGAISTTTSTDQTQRQLGLYLQEQAKIGRFTLLLSARHDRLRGDSLNRLNSVNTELDTHDTTGRIGAIYNFDNGLAPYVSYSTSFQPNLGVDYTGQALDPTTGEQFEVGLKYQPAHWGNSLVTLAAYDLKQDNIVAFDSVVGGSQQIGQVKVRGLELEARANLTSGLDLVGAFTYTDSSISRNVNPATIGNEMPLTPRKTASLWLDYRFGNQALAGLSTGVGVRYVGKSYANDLNNLAIPAVTLVDLAVRYNLGRISPQLAQTTLALNVTNLADREFVSGCNDLNNCYWGAGRTTRLTLTHRF